jgi:hypothetical protein
MADNPQFRRSDPNKKWIKSIAADTLPPIPGGRKHPINAAPRTSRDNLASKTSLNASRQKIRNPLSEFDDRRNAQERPIRKPEANAE